MAVACRCCPDRVSRSTRARRYDELRRRCRIAAGRDPGPAAAVIDSQSVKAAETVARSSRGLDAGKKINGRKRHIAVDVMGLLLVVVVTAASVQDRDGAKALLWRLSAAFRTGTLVWADGGYAGKLLTWAHANLRMTVEIVKRNAAHPFVVLRRRWEHHTGMAYWSMIIHDPATWPPAARHRPRPASRTAGSPSGRIGFPNRL
jgi:Transposase DDE domain